jgi:hypothetical protein
MLQEYTILDALAPERVSRLDFAPSTRPANLRYDLPHKARVELHRSICRTHLTSSKEAFRMANEDSTENFWSLSSSQLAAQINLIANGDSPAIDAATRAEASQLVSEWQDALNLPKANFQNQERRVVQLDALQKRTIEILVRISQSE